MKPLLIALLCIKVFFAADFSDDLLEIAHNAKINKEYNKALYYYKEAAKENNTQAQLILGQWYYKGKHVKKGYAKAYNYLSKAAQKGNENAIYALGVLYSNKKTTYYDLKKAFEHFKQLEQSNHLAALNRLGMFYTFGIANDKDYKKAIYLFEKASKQGFETAHCNLAYMYASGKGVFQNLGRAHAFAKQGYKNNNQICMNVWKVYKLENYPEDKGWKFKFYNKPAP